jgi:hypothetical protein
VSELRTEVACIWTPCVATWEHYHGGFPGGYTNPDDPEGAPILFTGSDPDPSAVRDYNGAALSSPETPHVVGSRRDPAFEGIADAVAALTSPEPRPSPSMSDLRELAEEAAEYGYSTVAIPPGSLLALLDFAASQAKEPDRE